MHKLLVILLMLITVISCNNDDNMDYTIGDDFIKSETSVAIIDTFKVNLSTFMADSVITSNTSVALVGNCQDEELGTIKAQSYFQLGLEGSSYSAEDDDQLDSLTIHLKYSGYTYGDTTKIRTINVYKLAETLELPKNQTSFNNSSVLSHEASPIGSITIAPQPLRRKTLEIRLKDSMGARLLSMIKDKDDTIKTGNTFQKYLPGIYIESETTDGSVLGFTLADTTCYMSLYASRFDLTTMDKKEINFKFPFTNPRVQFNHIESDRSGTDAALITNDQETDVSSTQTGNKSFIQAGTGIYTRIEFPGLPRLLEMSQQRILLKAELILRPMRQSDLNYDLPQNLYLYDTNRRNKTGNALTNSKGEALGATVVVDNQYHEDTYYQFDITQFISSKLSTGYSEGENAILVQVNRSSTYQGSIDRVVLADSHQGQYRPTLKIYYVFYK